MKIKLILSLCTAVFITQPLSAAAPQRNELTQAARDNDLAEVQRLLAAGANPDIPGDTPLYQAILNHNIKIVQALIQVGADLDIVNSNGYTPLHIAALLGNDQIVQALIQAGANPTIIGYAGQTPAQVATAKRYHWIAKLLEQAEKAYQQKNPMIKSAHKT